MGGDIKEMMSLLSNPDGMRDMLTQDTFRDEETGHEFSQADMIADVINILRMDTKRIGESVGVDIEVSQMTPERAAELLQEMAQGTGDGMVQVFDDIENKRMEVLREVEGDEAVEEHMDLKKVVMFSHPNTPEDLNDEN
jgi:hypothetical protein